MSHDGGPICIQYLKCSWYEQLKLMIGNTWIVSVVEWVCIRQMGHYMTHLLEWIGNRAHCILRWHIKPLRIALDWHAATKDAAREHNKGQLFHLTKATGLKRVPHDGWFRVNQFDSVKGTCQAPHIENPNLVCVILSGSFHVSKDTGKVLENWVGATAVHINSLTLTARAFLIGSRQWE